MMSAKYLNFSTIRFKNDALADRGCLRPAKHLAREDKMFGELKLRSLVELELYECDISLDWLNTAMNEFENIVHLTLHGTIFTDPMLLVDKKNYASRKLRTLKISGYRTLRFSDMNFCHFVENFPASVLDMTGTRIEFNKRVIYRLYGAHGDASDPFLTPPRDDFFSWPYVFGYLQMHSSTVKMFVANETNIALNNLKQLVNDTETSQLIIKVRNCINISEYERDRFKHSVSHEKLRRVIF